MLLQSGCYEATATIIYASEHSHWEWRLLHIVCEVVAIDASVNAIIRSLNNLGSISKSVKLLI